MDRQEFHMVAYVDYVRFAAVQSEMVKRFVYETGEKYSAPANPIDALIDKASGRDRAVAVRFLTWCADNYGREYLPADFLQRLMPEEPESLPAPKGEG